jgi:formylmethanofuran dehydrogenase subunit E-like metal-binding protein
MKTDSMTNLLKQNKASLSTVKVNKLLVALELLEEKERPSSKYPDKIKKYKALTDKGLEYGLNRENPSSPGQTTPYYYVEKFEALLTLINNAVDDVKS